MYEENYLEEENSSLDEEGSKKKYKRNKVKLTSAESAADFIAKIIYDHQGDQEKINYYRNLTYMAQTYISTIRLIKEQNEIKFLVKDKIRELLNMIRDNFYKMDKAFRSVLIGESFKKIEELLKKQETEINAKVQAAEINLYTMIEDKKSSLKNSSYGTDGWKTEITCNIINELPLRYVEIIMLTVTERHKMLTKK